MNGTKKLWAIGLVAIALLAPTFASTAEAGPRRVVVRAPAKVVVVKPAPRAAVTVRVTPAKEKVWVAGHWKRVSPRRSVWVAGHWVWR